MRRRRLLATVVSIGLLAGFAFVLFWFQPQKLLLDVEVDDADPAAAAATAPSGGAEPPGGAPGGADGPTTTGPAADLGRGRFSSRDHATSGTVRVIRVPDGTLVVRLEDLATDNGPDLYLYLSTNPADGREAAFDDDHVSLGRLQGNRGNQNYPVPPGTDLSRYASVVIWCDRFNSAFGAADIRPR